MSNTKQEILDLLAADTPTQGDWQLGKKKVLTKTGKDKYIYYAGLYKNVKINYLGFVKETDYNDPSKKNDKIVVNFSLIEGSDVPTEAALMNAASSHEIRFNKETEQNGIKTLSKNYNKIKKRIEEQGFDFKSAQLTERKDKFGEDMYIVSLPNIIINIKITEEQKDESRFNYFDFLPVENIE